jgi:trehalose-6-phosphatase
MTVTVNQRPGPGYHYHNPSRNDNQVLIDESQRSEANSLFQNLPTNQGRRTVDVNPVSHNFKGGQVTTGILKVSNLSEVLSLLTTHFLFFAAEKLKATLLRPVLGESLQC